jgi:hypothetical protein
VHKPGAVKAAAVKICPVVPFENRAIVFEVELVAVVAVPGGVVIIGVSGEIGFAGGRSGIISAGVYGCGWIISGCGGDVDPGSGNTETYMRTYEYLRGTFGSDQAGGKDSDEDK